MWTSISLGDAEAAVVRPRPTLFLATSIERVASALQATPVVESDDLDSFRAVAAKSDDAVWIFLQRDHSPVTGVEVVTSADVDLAQAALDVGLLLQLQPAEVIWIAL